MLLEPISLNILKIYTKIVNCLLMNIFDVVNRLKHIDNQIIVYNLFLKKIEDVFFFWGGGGLSVLMLYTISSMSLITKRRQISKIFLHAKSKKGKKRKKGSKAKIEK